MATRKKKVAGKKGGGKRKTAKKTAKKRSGKAIRGPMGSDVIRPPQRQK